MHIISINHNQASKYYKHKLNRVRERNAQPILEWFGASPRLLRPLLQATPLEDFSSTNFNSEDTIVLIQEISPLTLVLIQGIAPLT